MTKKKDRYPESWIPRIPAYSMSEITPPLPTLTKLEPTLTNVDGCDHPLPGYIFRPDPVMSTSPACPILHTAATPWQYPPPPAKHIPSQATCTSAHSFVGENGEQFVGGDRTRIVGGERTRIVGGERTRIVGGKWRLGRREGGFGFKLGLPAPRGGELGEQPPILAFRITKLFCPNSFN